jgi:hypothetical protein
MHALLLCPLLALLSASPGDTAADAAFQKHQWAKAAEAYQARTASSPDDGVAWLRLGISFVQLGKGTEAVAPLEKAQKLGVQASLVQYQLAQAAALAGDKDRVLGILKSLVDDDYFPFGPPAVQEKAFSGLARDPEFIKLSNAMEFNRAPCKQREGSSDYHQFDFWIGDWEVVDKAGDTLGATHVEAILGGCVLHEAWHGLGGGEGQSLTSWNPGQHRWEQYWVDGQGVPIFFTGRVEGGELRLRADTATRAGAPVQRRVTISKLPNGRLRQLSESSSDAGRTWATEYDFYYVKKAASH